MSSSASISPGSTLVPYVTPVSWVWQSSCSPLGSGQRCLYVLCVCICRKMCVFLPRLLSLFVAQRESKQLINIKSPEKSNRLVREGKQKPVVSRSIDAWALSSLVSTFQDTLQSSTLGLNWQVLPITCAQGCILRQSPPLCCVGDPVGGRTVLVLVQSHPVPHGAAEGRFPSSAHSWLSWMPQLTPACNTVSPWARGLWVGTSPLLVLPCCSGTGDVFLIS